MTNETNGPFTRWMNGSVTRTLSVAAAAVAGGLLGAFVFRKAGRLAFAAAVAFVARDLWMAEGRRKPA